MSLPLTDPLWAELYVGTPTLPETKMSRSEWAWLKQLSELPYSINMSNLDEIKVKFPFSNDSFWIKLKFFEGFPREMPEIECAFRDAFFFDWEPTQSSLKTIIYQYEEFAKVLDEAICLLKCIADEVDAFHLLKYSIDEEDPDQLIVHLKLQVDRESEETIVAKINWRCPGEFPQELRSTNPTRFLDLDCEQWDADRSLSINFAQICGVTESFC